MDRMIYVNMSGASANMSQQDILASNLANVSTTGFRAQLQAVRAVPVQGSGSSTRVYSLETTVGYDPTPGPISTTGRSLDVAMQGQAWLSVQAQDGTEAYTRAGSLIVDANGTLSTQNGNPVVGDGGPITVPPNTNISIGSDGTLSGTDSTGKTTNVGKLKLVTPSGRLNRGDDGLFRSADGNDLTLDPTAKLQSGALEGSNVNPISAMVEMIAAARQYDNQTRMMQNVDQNEKSASELLASAG